jgi:hypothetical protein
MLHSSKTHLLTLYFLDSGAYSDGFWDFFGFFQPTAYDWIREVGKLTREPASNVNTHITCLQSQINWFLERSSEYGSFQSFLWLC